MSWRASSSRVADHRKKEVGRRLAEKPEVAPEVGDCSFEVAAGAQVAGESAGGSVQFQQLRCIVDDGFDLGPVPDHARVAGETVDIAGLNAATA